MAAADDPMSEWTFTPEEDLLAGAGEVMHLAGPLRTASYALSEIVLTIQSEGEHLLETPEADAAGTICALTFRATRAVAVLVAAGLTTEAYGQLRRLAEFVVLAEHLRTPAGPEYAQQWLAGRTSPSKLFRGDQVKRKVQEYLSQGAHADVRHFAGLTRHDGSSVLWPARDVTRDMFVPWSATCLARDVLRPCETILGLKTRISGLLDQEIEMYAEAARLAAERVESDD